MDKEPVRAPVLRGRPQGRQHPAPLLDLPETAVHTLPRKPVVARAALTILIPRAVLGHPQATTAQRGLQPLASAVLWQV